MMKICIRRSVYVKQKILFTRTKRVHNIATVQDKYRDIRYLQLVLFKKKNKFYQLKKNVNENRQFRNSYHYREQRSIF